MILKKVVMLHKTTEITNKWTNPQDMLANFLQARLSPHLEPSIMQDGITQSTWCMESVTT